MVASSEALSCQELVELVTDYFEGALAPADRTRFEAHIRGCDGCDSYLEQMRTTIKLLGLLPQESLDPRAERALLQAFKSWKAS
jgi:anti-sigma factor RsiW